MAPHPSRPTPQAGVRRAWPVGLFGLCLLLGTLLLAAGWLQARAASPAPETQPALLLEVRGPIGPATTEYLEAGLQQAQARQAPVVILRIDTPGGLVTSLRDINRAILASPIPVISYVAPGGAQAASAGTYMVYASHLAAMAPGTNLGAATPVAMGGAPGQPEPANSPGSPSTPAPEPDEPTTNTPKRTEPPRNPDAGSQKAINDAVAYIRSLAELRGRNADWAEQAVRDAASLSAQQALAQNVIEILAPDVNDLLLQAHGRQVQVGSGTITLATAGLSVEILAPSWRARLLATITHPNLAYILLLIGIYGIIFELMNPGAIVPGTLGGISLLTALLALNMLPISYAGVALLLLGIALMAAEAFVPSFGILGLGGLAAFAFGSVLLFDTNVPGFSLDWPVIAFAAASSAALLVLVLAAVVRAHRRPPVTGAHTPVGETGHIVQWQQGQGSVQVHGETWQAVGPSHLQPGQTVRISARQGLRLEVAAAEAQAPPTVTSSS